MLCAPLRERMATGEYAAPPPNWNWPLGLIPKSDVSRFDRTSAPHLCTRLEGVLSAIPREALLDLEQVAVPCLHGSASGVKRLIKAVTECQRRVLVIERRKRRRGARETYGRLQSEVWRRCPRIGDYRVALLIGELHREIRVDSRLTWVRCWPRGVLHREPGRQLRLVRNPVIDARRKLIRDGGHFCRCGIRARAIWALRIVRQRIAGQNLRNLRIHRNDQRVAWKSCRVQAGALANSGNGDHFGDAQELPEALILHEVVSLVAAVIQPWYDDGSAVCQAELITDEWRNPVRIRERALVEEIASIEGRIAKKLENRSVFGVGSRPCDDIGKARGAAPDLGCHPTRTGPDLLHSIDIEIREGRTADLRVGTIGAVHGEHGCGAPLAVHSELLRKIRRSIGVRHGARREQEQLAEVALVQGQRRNGFARQLLAARALARAGRR